ncbi:MAG: winged helix-turn-helix domain-containing protein [Pseudomonadota bacterium]|nr:winged helix-turn-helix domain-containing protein [Pseudomonadota bacterium]
MLLDGGRAIDLRARTLGDETFTTREAELLAWLAERPHQVVTWEELHEQVWRFAPSVVSRAPYFTWRRLVKKVEPDPHRPRNLLSHHGDGVAYVPPAATAELGAVGSVAVSPPGPDTLASLEAYWSAEPYEASVAPPEHRALRPGLERLLATLEVPAARARVGLHLVRVLVDAGELQPALVLAERLVPGAEPPHDRYLLALRVRVLGTLGLHDELEAAGVALLGRCAASGDLRLTARTTANLARVRHTRGDSAGALTLLEQARAACQTVGDVDGEMRTCLTMGTVLSALGRWREAERAVRAALVRAVDQPAIQREARGQLALQHVMRGDLEAAEAGFAALAEPPDPFATHNYFLVRALLGHPVEALAGLARLAAHARAHATDGDLLHHLCLAAMIALAVDDDEAARLALEAERVRQELGDRTPIPRAVRGVVAARRGDHAQAERLAAPEPNALGGRFDVPLLCLRAEVALARDEMEAARALVAEARGIAERQHADPRALYVGWATLATTTR